MWVIFNKVVRVQAAAGAKGEIEVYKVRAGQRFHLKRVLYHFPAGSGYNLGLAVKYGAVQVSPDEGLARGDNNQYSLVEDNVFTSGDAIKVYYKNDDTTNAHEALVIIEGELE